MGALPIPLAWGHQFRLQDTFRPPDRFRPMAPSHSRSAGNGGSVRFVVRS
jgi:hypothetical protein